MFWAETLYGLKMQIRQGEGGGCCRTRETLGRWCSPSRPGAGELDAPQPRPGRGFRSRGGAARRGGWLGGPRAGAQGRGGQREGQVGKMRRVWCPALWDNQSARPSTALPLPATLRESSASGPLALGFWEREGAGDTRPGRFSCLPTIRGFSDGGTRWHLPPSRTAFGSKSQEAY